MIECEVVSAPVPVKSSPSEDYSYVSAETLLEWMDENVLEIINRDVFTTVTVATKSGPRAFRVSGQDAFYRALAKAKSFKESM